MSRIAVLVVGSPRSGTTLLQRLVTEVTGIPSGPETHFFNFVLRSQRLFRNDYTAMLAEYVGSTEIAGTPVASLNIDSIWKESGDLTSVFEAVAGAIAGSADQVCEKTPGHLWMARRLAGVLPELKVVAIVRDPRAVAASIVKAGFLDIPLVDLAELIRFERRLVDRLQRNLGPERCLVVRYEDMVRDEATVREGLSGFLGGAPAAPQHLVSLQLPWETWKIGYSGPITTDRVDAWHDELSAEDQLVISLVCREAIGMHAAPVEHLPMHLRHRKLGRRYIRRARLTWRWLMTFRVPLRR